MTSSGFAEVRCAIAAVARDRPAVVVGAVGCSVLWRRPVLMTRHLEAQFKATIGLPSDPSARQRKPGYKQELRRKTGGTYCTYAIRTRTRN